MIDKSTFEWPQARRGAVSITYDDALSINFNALGHFSGDRRDFDSLQGEIDAAMQTGGWIIYMIHGVGEGTHKLYIDVEEHQKLVDYLSAQQDSIWTAPVAQIAQYLQGYDPDYTTELGK
jgi:sialate O-acetylesterase